VRLITPQLALVSPLSAVLPPTFISASRLPLRTPYLTPCFFFALFGATGVTALGPKSNAFVLFEIERTFTEDESVGTPKALPKDIARFVKHGSCYAKTAPVPATFGSGDSASGGNASERDWAWDQEFEIPLPAAPRHILGMHVTVLDASKPRDKAFCGEVFIPAKKLMTHPVRIRLLVLGCPAFLTLGVFSGEGEILRTRGSRLHGVQREREPRLSDSLG
jgi:hypothetical protein